MHRSRSPRKSISLLAVVASMSIAQPALAAPTNAELQSMIRNLQQQLIQLQAQLNQKTSEDAETEAKLSEQQQQLEALAEQQESSSAANSGVSIGGYGELHYNNLSGEGGASDKDEVDLHRFVLFFGKSFTDRLRFNAELEVEHALAGEGKEGEVEVEQAYIEYDISDRTSARGGLFLVPVGILNETHEPPTFYGVERNPIEKNIIPSTWWVGGAGLTRKLGDSFTLDLAVHEGLKTTAGKNYAVRNGRQKTSEAQADDLAGTARLKWAAAPGVELAATYQVQGDVTQGNDASAGGADLFEAHVALERGRFGLRALYAHWALDGDGPEAVGADEQYGFYIEPSVRINETLGLFARYSLWDNQAGQDSIDSEKRQWDVGLNWWLHENVVVKADYQSQDNENGKDQNGINLGVGYMF